MGSQFGKPLPGDTVEEIYLGPQKAKDHLEKIEQLYLDGYTTHQIAGKIRAQPRDVGRNLREIRRRYERAATRQTPAIAISRCAEVQREAMKAWHRSQYPREIRDDRQSGLHNLRTDDGSGGNPVFLNMVLRSTKMMRQILKEKPATPAPAKKRHNLGDIVHTALVEVLTPEQLATLSTDQLQKPAGAAERCEQMAREYGEDSVSLAASRVSSESVEPLPEEAEEAGAGATNPIPRKTALGQTAIAQPLPRTRRLNRSRGRLTRF